MGGGEYCKVGLCALDCVNTEGRVCVRAPAHCCPPLPWSPSCCLQLSFISKTLSELPEVRSVFELAVSGLTFEKCVSIAYSRFYFLFRDTIQSLVSACGVFGSRWKLGPRLAHAVDAWFPWEAVALACVESPAHRSRSSPTMPPLAVATSSGAAQSGSPPLRTTTPPTSTTSCS